MSRILELVLNSLPFGLCVVTSDGTVEYTNIRFSELMRQCSPSTAATPLPLPAALQEMMSSIQNGEGETITRVVEMPEGQTVVAQAASVTEQMAKRTIITLYAAPASHTYSHPPDRPYFISQDATVNQNVSMAIQSAGQLTPVFITGEYGTGKGTLTRIMHIVTGREHFHHLSMLRYTEGEMLEMMKGLSNATVQISDAQLLSEQSYGALAEITTRNRIYLICTGTACNPKYLTLLGTQGALHLSISPLRERKEDIALIAKNIISELNTRMKTEVILSDQAVAAMMELPWPGNVIQLHGMLEYIVTHAKHPLIDKRAILTLAAAKGKSKPFNLKRRLAEYEKELIESVRTHCKTTRDLAQMLGISQPSVVRKMQRHRIP